MGIFESNIGKIFDNSFSGQITKDSLEKRNKLKQSFLDIGIPSKKDEKWRHINFRKILEKSGEYALPRIISNFDTSDIDNNRFFDLDDSYKIFIVNGVFLNSLLPKFGKGIILKELNNVNPYVEDDGLIILNSALCNGGLYLEIEEGVQLDKPISIVNINYGIDHNTIISPKIDIKVNKNASLKIFEEHINLSKDNGIFTNKVVSVDMDDNSNIYYYKYQDFESNEIVVDNIIADINRDCNFNLSTFSFGGGFVRNNLRMYIRDESSSLDLNGLIVLKGEHIVDNNVFVNHKAPNCYSNQLYKGIYGEKSMGVFNGAIFVDKIAQKTNAFQKNKNIIFSDKAEVYTKPQLEIFADDVKCSHGCTIGQIEDDSLFYCRSRGIDINRSKQIIVNAFLSDIVDKIKSDKIRDKISSKIENNIREIVLA